MPEETVRTLSVYGLRYGYRRLQQPAPRTEPVVILGGALQGMFGWPQMDNHVGAVADVVTADLPGMGGADALPAVPSAGIMRSALTRIIDDLGVEKVNLFGYSYGTSIALQCAQRNPGRVARLILGGVPSHVDDSQRSHWRRVEDRLQAGDLEGAATLAAEGLMCLDPDRTVHRRELALRYVRRSLLHALCHSPHAADSLCRVLGDPPDFSGGLAGVPTLVFAGEHDTVSSPRSNGSSPPASRKPVPHHHGVRPLGRPRTPRRRGGSRGPFLHRPASRDRPGARRAAAPASGGARCDGPRAHPEVLNRPVTSRLPARPHRRIARCGRAGESCAGPHSS